MEAPTIGKRQAKKTLSGKKTKKETVKNALAKPYENYWPLLTPEDSNQLKDNLERLLPRLRNDKISVPYAEIKKIPKCERRDFREKFSKLEPLEDKEGDKVNLIFGVNDVSRLLEDRQAGCILIASNVEPRLLVQHILDQAVLHSVPVLVVQDLRDVLKRKCGLSGAVVAIKNTVKSYTNLGLILQTVRMIYENYPAPETHINYHRQPRDTSFITISDSEYSSANLKETVESEVKSYHLERDSNKRRVFVPEKLKSSDEQAFISVETPTFVNLSNSKTNYRPLSVKRLKGNKNRNKRKIQRLKEKK